MCCNSLRHQFSYSYHMTILLVLLVLITIFHNEFSHGPSDIGRFLSSGRIIYDTYLDDIHLDKFISENSSFITVTAHKFIFSAQVAKHFLQACILIFHANTILLNNQHQ